MITITRRALVAATAVLALTAGAAFAQDKVQLRLASVNSETDQRAVALMEKFAPAVADFADFQPHWNGTLFQQGTELEAISSGDLEMSIASAQELATFFPEFSIFTAGYVHQDAAHQVAVFNEGKIVQLGSPEDIYQRPRTRFVADFLGETNLIEARVKVQNGGETILDWNGRTLRGHSLNGVPGPDETVSAAIRLESLIVSIEPLQRHNVLQGRLANPVFKGSRIAVEIAIDGFGKPPLRTYLLAADMPANLDQPVWIGFDADRLNILRD